MAWFMVDDKLHSHRKTVRANVEAMGLWVIAGSWCADQLYDGFIPDYMAERIDPKADEHAAQLVAAGLWHPAEKNGEQGWQFHNWDKFQPTREAVMAKREAARERMAKARGNKGAGSQEVRANSEGTSPAVALTPALPIPSHPNPSKPATRKRAATTIPEDWQPTDKHREFAARERVDLEREAFKFRNHAVANDRRQVNWNASFTTWLANAVSFAPKQAAQRNPNMPEGW